MYKAQIKNNETGKGVKKYKRWEKLSAHNYEIRYKLITTLAVRLENPVKAPTLDSALY